MENTVSEFERSVTEVGYLKPKNKNTQNCNVVCGVMWV